MVRGGDGVEYWLKPMYELLFTVKEACISNPGHFIIVTGDGQGLDVTKRKLKR